MIEKYSKDQFDTWLKEYRVDYAIECLKTSIDEIIDYINKKEDAEKAERCPNPVCKNGMMPVSKVVGRKLTTEMVKCPTCTDKPSAVGVEEIVAILKEHIRIDVSISNGLMGFSTPYKNDDGLRAIAHAIVEGMK